MIEFIKLDATSMVPKYVQIIDSIIHNITIGNMKNGDKIPSINKLSEEFYLSRDTVERAYGVLKKRNVLVSVYGKGTYISDVHMLTKKKVLFLVNKMSPFKMKVYHAFTKEIGEDYSSDLYNYHCDESLFLDLMAKHKSDYDYYVIMPHFRTETLLHATITSKVNKVISSLPKDKLIVLDNKDHQLKGDFVEVFQDFKKDIITALNLGKEKISKYKKLTLVYPRSTFYPYPIKIVTGFKEFCGLNNFEFEIIEEVSSETIIENKNLYITIEENDLVKIVNKVRSSKFKLGKNIGVISYNETPLKKLLGISVITTDFDAMGQEAAKMIVSNKKQKIKTSFNLIERDSL